MPRETLYSLTVQFGDCDPAGIVFYPNFLRWVDAASLAYFRACGLAPWRELERERGIVGTPLLEVRTRFHASATYPDELSVRTRIATWHRKAFVQEHVVQRGDTLVCEVQETRIFVVREGGVLRSIVPPEDIRSSCA